MLTNVKCKVLPKFSLLPTSKSLTHCTSKYVAITYHKYTGYG